MRLRPPVFDLTESIYQKYMLAQANWPAVTAK